MIVIWWTLYIIGSITIIIVWINLLTLFIKGCTVLLKKEWAQVKVVEGPPGPRGPRGEKGGPRRARPYGFLRKLRFQRPR